MPASTASQPSGQRCTYCDGTGDVHSPDGEWRGACTQCAQPTDRIQRQAEELIAAARRAGVVLRIDLVPRQPLAMGSLDMVADARVSRASQASGGS